jgi:hypothetical protein
MAVVVRSSSRYNGPRSSPAAVQLSLRSGHLQAIEGSLLLDHLRFRTHIMNQMAEPEYEERFTAFVDFLGFSEASNRTDDDTRLKILNLLQSLSALSQTPGGERLLRYVRPRTYRRNVADHRRKVDGLSFESVSSDDLS